MESRTKERLTGALILVAAVAILVPELLSGPGGGDAGERDAVEEAGPPLTTYDMVLETGANRAAQQDSLLPRTEAATDAGTAAPAPPPVAQPAPPVAELPAPAPAPPAAAAAPRTPPAAAPPPAPAPPAAAPARPAAQPQPAPQPAAATAGSWWVQIGSFSSADNANRLARELRAAGFSIDVSQVRANGRQLHRVRAGPARDRDAAQTLQTRLAAAGHKSSLVAP